MTEPADASPAAPPQPPEHLPDGCLILGVAEAGSGWARYDGLRDGVKVWIASASPENEAFAARATVLANLAHPRVAPLQFLAAAGEAASLTIEPIIEGPSLAEWAAALGRPLDQNEIDAIAAALLDGLEALHRAGAPHGALDAGRIIVTDAGPVLTRALPLGEETTLSRATIDADIRALAGILHDLIGPHPEAAYRPEFVQAVTLALGEGPGSRPPSIAAYRQLLFDDPTATDPEEPLEPAPALPELPAETPPAEPPSRKVPWLAIGLLAFFVFGGLAYVGIGPSKVVQPPPRPPAEAAAVPAPAPPPAPSLQERIASLSDRAELLRIAQAAPALQEAVEARLRALGLVRVAGREQVYWLQPGGGERFRECSDCPEMVLVPAGSFRMGSPATEADRLEDEDDRPGPGGAPVAVAIPAPFAMARTEVTVGEFAAFVRATGRDMGGGCFARIAGRRLTPEFSWSDPGFAQTDRHPVACVSYEDAVAYAAWLSERTGGLYRLPSEPEWEYAARAGAEGRFAHGESDAELCRYANVADATAAQAFAGWVAAPCEDGATTTAPVASYQPNRFGLHDMHGNLWEWVADCQSDSLRHFLPPEQAGGARPDGLCQAGAPRIIRGGSWSDPPARARSAARLSGPPATRDRIVGFRLARTLDPGR